ncbi:peripheral-type benzodiazepine receptor-associated protein 1-like isoform X1 [Oncorhynchus clarkii lewisi]|uniref:peripheral-type benzodiazepine receptor-associated protein 1-like isoform X1 n=1 Tax=Oncorhynchus clarkii lewisi TaxID=490388 RepID=UPI0039B9AD57
MGKDRGGNAMVLSSKRPCHGWGDHGRDLEKLRSTLEAEKCRNHQAHQRFSLELRRLREEAEREQQRALRELTARHERQKALELQRLQEVLRREQAAEVRHLLRYKGQELKAVGTGLEREAATRQARELQHRLAEEANTTITKSGWKSRGENVDREPGCVCSGASCRKLEQLLVRLQVTDRDGEQAVFLQRLRQELDLEKDLCHLLKVDGHGRRLGPREVKERNQSSSRALKTRHRSKSCVHLSSSTTQDQEDHSHRSGPPPLARSRSLSQSSKSPSSPPPKKRTRREHMNVASGRNLSAAARCSSPLAGDTCRSTSSPQTTSSPHAGWDLQSKSPGSDKSSPSKYSDKDNMENGTDYGFLVRQNSELLQALDEMEKTCTNLREENGLLRKSSVPETEEKVRRLRRKNTELAVIAKRLEDRARKLQEANLKVVNAPAPVRPGAVEQYKRAFARQRARDLAQHADTLLYKDKEIAALQQECRHLETRLGTAKGCPIPSSVVEFERLLRESQKEVLRLQRQLSVSSSRVTSSKETSCREHNGHDRPCTPEEKRKENVAAETPCVALDEAPSRCEETPREEEESGSRVTPPSLGLCPAPTPSLSHQEEHTEEQRLQLLEQELSKKRKECENLEHEVRKRQKKCLDLESLLEDERGKNEQLEEEADLLRRKAQPLDQARVENEELREDLSEVTAQRDSVLEENQRLRAKLENLEQVLKHMREVAERRQQLELEHEQALAILKFKQDEIKRLQRAEFFAKREHEGVVQLLEDLIQLVLQRELSKVRELEDKCRSQSEQFGLLSHELETFRLQAGKLDLAGSALLTNHALCHLTNGVGLAGDVAATLQMGATPHAAGLTRSPTTKHRELPTISLTKSSSSPKSVSDTTHLSPKSSESHHSPHHSPRRTSPTPHEVDTASEVEELDIDVSPAPYTALRGAAKLQVFIGRYSYNPYDGPNDNPEVELPLTAGEYIYVYGGMDDDGFYEGELMDGRRGLVPSNFVERVSDDDMMSAHVPEGTDISHNSLLDSSLHSASHQHHLRLGSPGTSERTDPTFAASNPGPLSVSFPSGEQVPAPSDPSPRPLLSPAPLTNGLDLDLEVGVDTVPYPRKLTLIKQLAKSIIIGWDGPLVPAGWGNVWSYNVYVDQELRLNVPFGSQTKAVLERLDVNLKAYRVSVQSLTERGSSDQLRCSMLVGRDVCVAPTQLRVDRVTATSASLSWLPSNSNYVHIVSLNEEEMELVKAGSYSLCLSNLTPSLHYTVKVEARPHHTPWELPQERREHKTATTTFTVLAAGPPDAPLDVQLEQGPSPGIALISWLPVTIDAAGTSNGVRVTGYTIYADKKKVLEVSSPTAGSALMGPSQIQSLMTAHQLTVRTMSGHGESTDSVPVNVPAKLAAIMTDQASATSAPCSLSPPVHQSPPYQSPPVHQSPPFLSSSPPVQPQSPSYGNSAAKVSTLPYATASPPLDAHAMVPNGGLPSANSPPVHTLHTEASSPLPASYAEAWANPLAKSPVPPRDALAVHEATMSPPVAPNYQAKLPSVPSAYEAMMSPPIQPAYQAMLPPASHINTTVNAALPPSQSPVPVLVPAAAMEQSRAVTEIPGAPRPVMSITDFLPMEDYSRANLSTPEPCPTPPQDRHSLQPPKAPSPLESEPDYSMERSTTRLVSMEEFLRQEKDPGFSRQPQGYAVGLVEPPYGATENSRGSDLSDILEEEEEDMYSDPPGPALARGYTTGADRPDQWEVPDSDEEILESILKLPPQAHAQAYHYHHGHHHLNKHLFSIPEVTDEEDNSVDEDYNHRRHRRQSQARPSRTHLHPDDPHYHRTRDQPHHHHHSPRAEAKEPLPRHSGGAVVRARPQHRVHYADTVDSISYPEEGELVLGPSKEMWVRQAPQKVHSSGGRNGVGTVALVGGLGDRLRREALIRSQMAVAALTSQATGHAPCSYLVSKTVRTVKSPVGSVAEIDIEYGTDEEDPLTYDRGERGEVVVEQMSSEWWVEGSPPDPLTLALRRGKPALQAIAAAAAEWEPGRDPSMEASAGWSGQAELSPKLTRAEARQELNESMEPVRPIGDNEVRIFVALFPYDPVNMSPNPDAAEEELPFREGQIIKIYGDKDSDGFYHGELNGRHGYVPCNMVSEIQVEDEETRETLLQQGFLSTHANMEKIGTRSHAKLPRRPVPPQKPRRSKKVESTAMWEDSLESSSQDPSQSGVAMANPAGPVPRRMKAIFDYDPRESSPNADIEAELTFSAGDVIYVFGDMDDDGFFYGDLNGHKGLVPSNFLQAMPEAPRKAPPPDPQPPPLAEPRRELQVSPSTSMKQTTPEEVPHSPLQTGLSGPVQTHIHHLDLNPSAAAAMIDPSMDPGPGAYYPNPAPRQAAPRISTSPPHVPPESPSQTDQTNASPPGKKKKGFFSKGKKLFKKLGSSKKD